MDKKQMWVVVGVALVVAIIASLATNAVVTGNAIRVQKNALGPAVYTKAEVDSLLLNLNYVSPEGGKLTIQGHKGPGYTGTFAGDNSGIIFGPATGFAYLGNNATIYYQTNDAGERLIVNSSALEFQAKNIFIKSISDESIYYNSKKYYLCIGDLGFVYKSKIPCV